MGGEIMEQLFSTDDGYNAVRTNIIHKSFKHGENLKIGAFCIIEEDVIIGDNVEIQNYVLLRKGTRIGNNCYIDSYVRSSGDNIIGNNVTLRFGSTIARKVFVGNDVFISPNVMTVFSLPDGSKSKGTFIKNGAFIGTAAVIGPSVIIGEDVIIGTNSFVNRDCMEGVYAGVPAKKIR
jgi:UDP-N-acetylglucosamine acyltransferase